MSEEDIITITEKPDVIYQNHAKNVRLDKGLDKDCTQSDEEVIQIDLNGNSRSEKKPLLQRLPSVLKPDFGKLRHNLNKVNCMKRRKEDEEIPILQSRKSIDISVGLARRASLFLFTRRAVCVHPYHPYTPKQTTRKIYVGSEDH